MKNSQSLDLTIFQQIATPTILRENHCTIIGNLTLVLLSFLDIATGPTIPFHVLYLFPVSVIAFHSRKDSHVIGAVLISLFCQLVVVISLNEVSSVDQMFTFLLMSVTNIIFVVIVRRARANSLDSERSASTDPLTQLLNRRALDQALNAEIVRQRRYGGYFSLALIDLDGFKGLNDSMGHKAGDKALILLATILRDETRQSDTIARLGGDEFVVLMPNTKASDCEILCQSLCHVIDKRMIEELSYSITASIGFTTIEQLTNCSNDILSTADKAMYKAKSTGKGRVVKGYVEET